MQKSLKGSTPATMQTSSRPSSILARRRDLHPAAERGSIGESGQDRGLIAAVGPACVFAVACLAAVGRLRIFIGNGANVKMVGARLSTYPPCPRSQRGNPLARWATSPSRPTPATQQKYRGLCGAGAPPALSTAEMIPRSTARTLPMPPQNFRQAASESRTRRSPSARAKSFPLPAGTTNTGNPSRTNCPRCR